MIVEESKRGPMTAYEITWTNGHVETIWAHQIDWPDTLRGGLGLFGSVATETTFEPRVRFMGEIDGRWQPILSARESDIRTIRNKVTERHGIGGAL